MATHRRSPAAVISTLLLIAATAATLPRPLASQAAPRLPPGAIEVLVAPYGGLAILRTEGVSATALGLHLVLASERRLALALRGAVLGGNLGSVGGSVLTGDLLLRLFGGYQYSLGLTGGAARVAERNWATAGTRFTALWLKVPDESYPVTGHLWADFRYALSESTTGYRTDGRLWAEVMMTFQIPLIVSRR